jgi:signal transduction histidine kinase
MANGVPPVEPQGLRLLRLAIHELATPLGVVSGYHRMLLKDNAGALSDQQRQMLEVANTAVVRLLALLQEMKDLAKLLEPTTTFNRSKLNLSSLLAETINALPTDNDRGVRIVLTNPADPATVNGDTVRLRTAFAFVLSALRRELVTSAKLAVRIGRSMHDGTKQVRISIADEARIDAIDRAEPGNLVAFEEFRSGCGFGLVIARRILTAYGGQLWSPTEESRAGALVVLPEA